MKYIIHWGYERYIDEIVEAPTHVAATEIPEDLVRRFREASAVLGEVEQQIIALHREPFTSGIAADYADSAE